MKKKSFRKITGWAMAYERNGITLFVMTRDKTRRAAIAAMQVAGFLVKFPRHVKRSVMVPAQTHERVQDMPEAGPVKYIEY